MSDKTKQLIQDFVDYLMPALTPYESSLYLFLLRLSLLQDGAEQVRIGKRTIAESFGSGAQGAEISYKQVTKVLQNLESKGCIVIGDTIRDGTMYTVVQPRDIPLVKEKIAAPAPIDEDEDFFTDSDKRILLFERDSWTCQYCGDRVTKDNATIDHYVPQSKGGNHSKANLRTCCLVCNSIKSGKSFEEAAPFILKSIQERRQKQQK
ncbi:MAG: HNH endonuclease [Deltaproteobacteria bacterium]|nr:HNH endonuclease [Deltaproteobacteria bacterium]